MIENKEFFVSAAFGGVVMRFGPFTGPQAGEVINQLHPYKVQLAIVCNCGNEFNLEEFVSATGVEKLTEEEYKAREEEVAEIMKGTEK